MTEANEVRLQKLLAEAGFGSRRHCETLIAEGRVEVDGRTVSEMGVKVDPAEAKIFVDGQKIRAERKRYLAVHKPAGVLSTNWDPDGRVRIVDLIPTEQRVYHVGRLDRSSEGLIIVTNDGSLANRLTHPRYGVTKTYLVRVAGVPSPDDLQKLQRGLHLAEGRAKFDQVRLKKKFKTGTELEIVLSEGRNREIRRLLARIGHKVLRLRRTAIGKFKLGNLPPGDYRELTRRDLDLLKTPAAPRSKPSRQTRSRTGKRSSQSKSARSTSSRRTSRK